MQKIRASAATEDPANELSAQPHNTERDKLIRAQTLERARSNTRALEKATFVGHVTDLIVSPEEAALPRPQSFLVEQRGDWTLPIHFHLQEQFQLFVSGSGSIGRHAIGPGYVHYASAHSGYGPLVSEADGIAYLTLRLVSDTGAWYLPEQREHLDRNAKKRQRTAQAVSPLGAEALRALTEPTVEAVLPCDASGLAAWRVRLPPNGRAPAPAGIVPGSGRFYVLMQGGLRLQGDTLSGLATVFVSPEDTIELEASREGAEVMVLQFPAHEAIDTNPPEGDTA